MIKPQPQLAGPIEAKITTRDLRELTMRDPTATNTSNFEPSHREPSRETHMRNHPQEKKMTSNNSVNCLFGPKTQMQEQTPRPKFDRNEQQEFNSAQTTKAFGPTSKILKPSQSADLYQK